MVNNINYVCGWYQNNHTLIILTTLDARRERVSQMSDSFLNRSEKFGVCHLPVYSLTLN